MKRFLAAVVVPLSFALAACGGNGGTVAAQASPEAAIALSPDAIRGAIAGKPPAVAYRLQNDDGGVEPIVSTPYSRIVAAAEQARSEYRPFTEADVTPGLAAPLVGIYAFDQGGRIVAIVIAPRESQDASLAIRPTTTERFELSGQAGTIAMFPLTALNEKNEVRVVYEGATSPCRGQGPVKGMAQCIMPIEIEKGS